MKIDSRRAREYLSFAMDASLAEHDDRYHGGHFDPSKGTCGKRDGMSGGDDSDDLGGEDPKERTTKLAPNGKRSNLTNRQYAQVRSKEFKDWFGDWESNVLSSMTEDESKALVKKWRDGRVEFVNKNNGRKAELKADWSKLFSAKAKGQSASYEAHYAAVGALDRLFSDSVVMWREKPRNGSEDIASYAKYGKAFWFGGSTYLAKMTVKEYSPSIGIKDGFYSIEAMEVEKVNVAGNNGAISVKGQFLDRDVGRMISKQISDVNATSKVVDENGEPLVLFHGTKDSSFNTFDPKKIGEWNFGFHFGTRHAAETRVEKDGQFKEVFLNARNPFRCSDGFGIPKALVFDELAAIARKRGEDEIDDELVRCGDKAEELWENGFKDESRVSEECSKTFVDALGKLGFDSVVYENEYEEDENSGEDSWITISPMQIKSATDNSGSFDPNDPDIRH